MEAVINILIFSKISHFELEQGFFTGSDTGG